MAAARTSRWCAALASFTLLVLVWDMPLSAQEEPPSSPAALSAEQLAQLLAPIALYPDALLGQVLAASTYPLEVVKAARWSKANPNLKGADLEAALQQQPWDPSVKALAAVPQVLAMMSDKLDWTQALGDAYLAQPDDIATTIQQLRARADGAGNLKPSKEQRVKRVPAPPHVVGEAPLPDYYIIEPVDPEIIYVPIYDPYLVYGTWPYPAYRPFYWYPPGYVTVGAFAFGGPVVVRSALWATYDWRARRVAIDVHRFNTFHRTAIASSSWRHNPRHRGNLPYSSRVLQRQFGTTATGVQGLSKRGIDSQRHPNGRITTNPQLLHTRTITSTGRDSIHVNRNIDLDRTNTVRPQTGGMIHVNRNVGIGNTRSVGLPRNVNAVNPSLNRGVSVNRSVHVNRNVGSSVHVNRHVASPRGHGGKAPQHKGDR